MHRTKIQPNNHRKYSIRTQSGLRGWRQRLRSVYGTFFSFVAYCNVYNNHVSLGYKTPAEAWKDNPVIEGSTNLSDYRNASTGFKYGG